MAKKQEQQPKPQQPQRQPDTLSPQPQQPDQYRKERVIEGAPKTIRPIEYYTPETPPPDPPPPPPPPPTDPKE